MMHIDMMGGGGKESEENREKLTYDNRHADEGIVAPAATVPTTGAPARSEPAESTDGNSMQNMPGMDVQHEGHSMPGMSNGGTPAPAQQQ